MQNKIFKQNLEFKNVYVNKTKKTYKPNCDFLGEVTSSGGWKGDGN